MPSQSRRSSRKRASWCAEARLVSITSANFCEQISCTGPFIKYGEPVSALFSCCRLRAHAIAVCQQVVQACVNSGTDYVDISAQPKHSCLQIDLTETAGEPQYVRKMIDKYHKAAEDKGVIIVPNCGFDS